MLFFEAHQPYWALIKAESQEHALKLYVEVVAEDEGDLELKEVHRDYAVALFSRILSEDGKEIPLKEVVEQIQNDKSSVLAVDGALL